MILTTHALTGAVIGKSLSHPAAIIIASIVIHYVMDGFRHSEYFDDRTATLKNSWWKVALDVSIGLFVISLYLFSASPAPKDIFNILLGTFFSMFPDLLTVIHWKFKDIKILAAIKRFHAFAHRYSKFPKYSKERQWTLRNALNDIFISVIAAIILFL